MKSLFLFYFVLKIVPLFIQIVSLLNWMQAALLVLDVENPDICDHVSSILSQVLNKVESAYLRWSSSPVGVSFKLVCHVLHSLLKS